MQHNIYNGIDVKVYSSASGNLKYDFIVKANADYRKIKLQFEGVTPEITSEGKLRIVTSCNETFELPPYTYQIIEGEKQTIPCKFVLNDNILTFKLEEKYYNKKYELIIDPELIFATYNGTDVILHENSVINDNKGNLYFGGTCFVGNWPTTVGAFQTTNAGNNDIVINKFNANGSDLLFSTFYGGALAERYGGCKVNSLNQLVVFGNSNSINIPVTNNAYDITQNGYNDFFLAKFSENGSQLIGGTYIGGNANDYLSVFSNICIEIDTNDNIWCAGRSNSHPQIQNLNTFPVTPNAFRANPYIYFSGGLYQSYNSVFFKINSDLSSLLYSSFFYDSIQCQGVTTDIREIKLNNDDNLLIFGSGCPPITPNAAILNPTFTIGQTSYLRNFVSLINTQTGGLMYSTYVNRYPPLTNQAIPNIGQWNNKLNVDCNNNVYVLGAFDYMNNNGWTNDTLGQLTLTIFSSDLSSVINSTRFGFSNSSYVGRHRALTIDGCGNIYIVADVNSLTPMPITANAIDSVQKAYWKGVFGPNISSLKYGSYFGTDSLFHLQSNTNYTVNSTITKSGTLYDIVLSRNTQPWSQISPWAYQTTPTTSSSNRNIISFKFRFDVFPVRTRITSGGGAGVDNIHVVKNCTQAQIDFVKDTLDGLPLAVQLELLGDAINGVDYEYVADSIVFSVNDTVKTIFIKPTPNATPGRYVVINTIAPCECDRVPISSDTVWIYEKLKVELTHIAQMRLFKNFQKKYWLKIL